MTTNDTTTAQAVTRELADAFGAGWRPTGGTFAKLADDAPAWIPETLARDLHVAVDGRIARLPDDWIYATAAGAADALAGYEDTTDDDCAHEIAEGLVDIYTKDLFRWAGDHEYNRALIAEAEQEYGIPEAGRSMDEQIQAGQYLGAARIVAHLRGVIEDETNTREEDAR